MATDERNFRSSYYEKVGCRGVEEKKSLEILLKDKPWDKAKLKQFCLRFTLPAAYRSLVWKVLLGVLPVYTDSHKFVMYQRQQQYLDLLHALRAMKLINNTTPKPQILLAMYSLENCGFRRNFELDQNFALIIEALLEMYQEDADVYWLAKGFYNILQSYDKEIPKLIEHVKKIVETEDADLYNHLVEIKAFDVLPFPRWFKTCFAGVLDENSLVKIWDKMCGGAPKTLVAFVAAVLLITLRWNLLKARGQEQLFKSLSSIPDQTEEAIVNKAIEKWQYGANVQTDNLVKK